jgi:hypothetical protein
MPHLMVQKGSPVPRYVVDKFRYNIFVRSRIPDMSLVKFPPVIVDLLHLFVRTFKKRNIIQVPLIIVAIILFREHIMIETAKVIFF